MTLPNSWVLFFVHQKEELYTLEYLQQFLTRLVERNCYLAPASEIASLNIWRNYLVNASASQNQPYKQEVSNEALKPEVSTALQQQILAYTTELQEQLTIAARSMARSPLALGFEFTVTLVPGEGYILLSVEQERFFHPTLDGLTKYRYWLRVLEEVYECWQPLYAHEFTHQGPPSINPSWEEVHALHIPALYRLNIYGPELVQQMGLQRLLNAPAWLCRELTGSGCLLIPADPHGFCAPNFYTYDGVAKYLGFPPLEPEKEDD